MRGVTDHRISLAAVAANRYTPIIRNHRNSNPLNKTAASNRNYLHRVPSEDTAEDNNF